MNSWVIMCLHTDKYVFHCIFFISEFIVRIMTSTNFFSSLFFFFFPCHSSSSSSQRSVRRGQKMPTQRHRRGVCRQVHQEEAQQVESPRRDQGGHRARGEHPEGDPPPQHHHPARGLWEQGGGHPHPGAVSGVFVVGLWGASWLWSSHVPVWQKQNFI